MRNTALKARDQANDGKTSSLVAAMTDLQSRAASLSDASTAHARLLLELHVRTTPILSHTENLKPIFLQAETKHPIFNTSVFTYDDQIIFMSRSSSLRKIRDKISFYASTPHDTINIIHYFGKDFTPIRIEVLDDSLLRDSCRSAQYGVEDCRFFTWKGALWAIGAGVSPSADGGLYVTQILFRIQDSKIIEFHEIGSPFNKVEKNWIPYVSGERLFLIHSFVPMIVYEFSSGQITLAFSTNESVDNIFSIRGGTPLIPWKGGMLGVVHESPILVDKYYYRHKFIFLDTNLNVLEFGEPWFILKRGIEFACGLVKTDDKIILSFGVSDQKAAYCELSVDLVDRWITT